jgi:hypothetical protein
MIFFDFLYYEICKVYLKTIDSSPEFAAACICSLLECSVIWIAVNIYSIVTGDKFTINNAVIVIVSLSFIVINYVRYIYSEDSDYKVIKIKWEAQTEAKRIRYRVLLVIFCLLTTVGSLILTIYVGSLANPSS